MQVSLIAYAVAGQFLGMAYFDYYYMLVVSVAATSWLIRKRRAGMSDEEWARTKPAGLLENGRLVIPWLKKKRLRGAMPHG